MSLKNVVWAVANATIVKFFKIYMENMHELEWSKSHFFAGAKCDVLLNNMCECFNSMILDARQASYNFVGEIKIYS